MKAYPQAVLDMFDNNRLNYAHLLTIHFDTPIRYTSAGFDINYLGDNYISSGDLIGVGELTQNIGQSVTEMQINLKLGGPASNATYLNNVYRTPVEVHRAFLDEGNNIIHLERIWRGYVVSYADSDQELTLTLNVANVWADFDSVNPWRTTPTSHHRRHSNDECFKYAAKAEEVIYWGENPTNSGEQ